MDSRGTDNLEDECNGLVNFEIGAPEVNCDGARLLAAQHTRQRPRLIRLGSCRYR